MILLKKQIEILENAGFNSEGGGAWVLRHEGPRSQTEIIAIQSNTHRQYLNVQLRVRINKGDAISYQLGHMTVGQLSDFSAPFRSAFKRPDSSL